MFISFLIQNVLANCCQLSICLSDLLLFSMSKGSIKRASTTNSSSASTSGASSSRSLSDGASGSSTSSEPSGGQGSTQQKRQASPSNSALGSTKVPKWFKVGKLMKYPNYEDKKIALSNIKIILVHNPNCAMKSGLMPIWKVFSSRLHRLICIWKASFKEKSLGQNSLPWPLIVISFCTWEYGFELIPLARSATLCFVSCSIQCIIYCENIIN